MSELLKVQCARHSAAPLLASGRSSVTICACCLLCRYPMIRSVISRAGTLVSFQKPDSEFTEACELRT
jgi:hypothetical protein